MPLLHQAIRRCLLVNQADAGYVPITSPMQIPGITAYWSSKEAAVEGYVDGNAVSQLKDYTGNLNHWNQAVGGEQGVWKAALYNGYGAIRLDNTNDGYTGTYDFGAQPKKGTVAVLFAPRRTDANAKTILNSDAHDYWGILSVNQGIVESTGISTIEASDGRYASDAGKLVGVVTTATDAGDPELWVNHHRSGTISSASGPEDVDIGYEGSGTPGDADIVEVIIWNRTLTADEIRDLFIFWYQTFGLALEVFYDFFESAAGTSLNGYASKGSNLSDLGGVHDWSSTPWVAKQNYIESRYDYPTSAGLDLNGLSICGQTAVASGTTKDTYLRVFGGAENDYRYRLAAARLVIPIPWGTNWSRIRFGFLLSTRDAGSAPPGSYMDNEFTYGLCSGSVNTPGTGTIDHFLGIGNYASGSWGYSAGNYYRHSSLGVRIVDNVRTEVGSINNRDITLTPATYRNGYSVDVVKGSPNFSVYRSYPDNYTYSYSSKLRWAREMEGSTLVTYWNPTYMAQETARTTAIDEATNGYFDHFCIAWEGTHFEMELSAIFMERLSSL